MAPLRERCNLFKGSLRVAPRPYIPDTWEVPADHPSSRRFFVDKATGRTSSECEGPGWERERILKLWNSRQALRVWACRRLIDRLGEEEARRRINELQARLHRDIPGPNAYLDLLLSITYEVVTLRRRADRWTRLRNEIQKKAESDTNWWGAVAASLGSWGEAGADAAKAIASSVDSLVESLGAASELWSKGGVGGALSEAQKSFLGAGRASWDWIDYQTLPRKLKSPDINWIVAQAIVRYRENHPDHTTEVAVRHVSRYLDMLGCSLDSELAARLSGGAAAAGRSAG
jgi:hypothetical protein